MQKKEKKKKEGGITIGNFPIFNGKHFGSDHKLICASRLVSNSICEGGEEFDLPTCFNIMKYIS